jgi:hypothetical protein
MISMAKSGESSAKSMAKQRRKTSKSLAAKGAEIENGSGEIISNGGLSGKIFEAKLSAAAAAKAKERNSHRENERKAAKEKRAQKMKIGNGGWRGVCAAAKWRK